VLYSDVMRPLLSNVRATIYSSAPPSGSHPVLLFHPSCPPPRITFRLQSQLFRVLPAQLDGLDGVDHGRVHFLKKGRRRQYVRIVIDTENQGS
jgi:hypothetical protein